LKKRATATKTKTTKAKTYTDQAATWVALWDKFCPADMRDLPTCHKENGGELAFAVNLLDREWKFDWAIQNYKIAVEVDGGKAMAAWSTRYNRCVVIGRHNQDADLVKHNAATMLGWLVFHFSPKMLDLNAVDIVAQAVRLRRREQK
jgi:very-short-patch-repair endonuclease